ncbi:MAG: alpha-amylase, partial [Anaerolineae bacterium]|nr:alpha-amylase [Anaerolineae bacterium]
MVPNHMGIDSRWVVEQPDLFLGVPQPPFPTYSFNGPDLSPQQQVSIHLEDHYTDRTDAAVVFQRLDRSSGQARYIYHGNDGTHMPWNDTAQLDFLNPQTREAVIQEILKVARDFPIIRFDAAMTLVKEHIQRLWYPGPGSRGAVPSRHDHGLSPEQFDALIPQEFWRQVVERIALDAPNTLLLAEAFWLMEGYFVHSLGMHRVYNSAFMHMLRDEDNANFRKLLRNTLSFDPRILARFVNFMSNPDEQTAVEQFGRDDKYFGICTLLATLPGLPMFAHGQFEGLSEKYGMEYARPRLDEQPDENLLARHHRQIVPLLHRRPLFAGIEHFELYDFITSHGEVCQDIIAFSNRDDNHCALVVYHNKYADHAGWIKQGISNSLADALALDVAPHTFTTFRDHLTGLEYIYANSELRSRGLPLQLDAYKARVFLDFHQVLDDQDQRCAKLARHLAGAGVPSLAHAFHQLHWSSANLPLHTLYHPDLFTPLLQAASPPLQAAAIDQLIAQFTAVASAAQPHASPAAAHAALKADLRRRLQAVLCLDSLAERFPLPRSRKYKSVQSILAAAPQGPLFTRLVFVAWALTDALAALLPRHPGIFTLDSWFQVWQLDQILSHLFQQFGLDVDRALAAVRILLSQHSWRRLPSSRRQRSYRTLLVWLDDAQVQRFLQCSSQRGILSFNPTAAEHFLWLMLALAAVEITAAPSSASPAAAEQIVDAYDIVFKLLKTLPSSRAQVGIWLEAVKP